MAKEKLVTGPRWAPDTRTDWPTDCRRKLTSTSTSELNKWQLKNSSCSAVYKNKHQLIKWCTSYSTRNISVVVFSHIDIEVLRAESNSRVID
jgi:hypothetical protein